MTNASDSHYHFNSQVQLGKKLSGSFPESLVKNEPMLFSCDLKSSLELGGPITKAFIDALPDDWKNASDFILDTRVHMLMEGWFPCIPGFHHDDVPRATPTSQPDYDHPEYLSQHALCLVNGDICPTQFAIGECDLPKVPEGEVIYEHWHNDVVQLLDNGKLQSFSAPTNQVVFFDWQSIHQGTQAVSGGWRWFARASRNTNRKPTNELRRQVQVYLSNPMAGW